MLQKAEPLMVADRAVQLIKAVDFENTFEGATVEPAAARKQ